jgi:hypothetical protein
MLAEFCCLRSKEKEPGMSTKVVGQRLPGIFCRGEGLKFGEDEFLYNKDGTFFIPYIHKQAPPHYASTGQEISDPGKPIPGVLLAQLHEVLTRMPDEALEAWISEKHRSLRK